MGEESWRTWVDEEEGVEALFGVEDLHGHVDGFPGLLLCRPSAWSLGRELERYTYRGRERKDSRDDRRSTDADPDVRDGRNPGKKVGGDGHLGDSLHLVGFEQHRELCEGQ